MSEQEDRAKKIEAAHQAIKNFDAYIDGQNVPELTRMLTELRMLVVPDPSHEQVRGEILGADHDFPVEYVQMELRDRLMGIEQYRTFSRESIDTELVKVIAWGELFIKLIGKN